ncbi:phosphomannomutase [Dyadobacter sp. BE34]|uniref:Phosphomannomutase n=1 Tax=Dyadobacter fermentans TaxID=94254 RepID=A0ABU1QRJ1_9BACT|nr:MULTISPECIES: phosphoglucosamine mutase [Dyadobacter]MDR6803375.1 phosphomannomutase [Dyadobacter fermentans]MDR7041116.1 phosphomannomutase [Dyadobacter sp. BE242]MDR7195519.1 phosphomannomutase [Dyadobacter sp. BE34]MDR7260926.1 phosphomannomutase [Dyadobacter sp. BE32]
MTLIKSISGIRGIVGGKSGEALTPIDVVKFAAAYGTWVRRTNPQNLKVVIGRDARLSGEMVSRLVAGTLQGVGLNVLDLGLSTTPTVEIAVKAEGAAGGIILTASHNPIQWNALKLLNHEGEFISEAEGAEVLRIADEEDFLFPDVKKLGSYASDNTYLQKHIDHVLSLALVDVEAIKNANFKIVVDAVNSTGGIAVPFLLEALGVDPKNIKKLNCEPTGNFAHNPEPLSEHLHDISKELNNGSYNLGIVVDPDVDRLALMCEDGTPFGEEYTLVAVADYVLKHTPGNTVSNLSSTAALRDVTIKAGGQYLASAVGEVNVVNAMKANNAVIGGEGNGGVIYPESHYGRDALVGIALFLTHLAKSGKKASVLRRSYPNYYISKNKIELTPEINVDNILDRIQTRYSKQPVNTVDGVRIEFDREWVHLRRSNTEPIIRIYSESETQTTATSLANKIISDIKEIISEPKK